MSNTAQALKTALEVREIHYRYKNFHELYMQQEWIAFLAAKIIAGRYMFD